MCVSKMTMQSRRSMVHHPLRHLHLQAARGEPPSPFFLSLMAAPPARRFFFFFSFFS
jgi:hypothetical protein